MKTVWKRLGILLLLWSVVGGQAWACCGCSGLSLKEAYRSTHRIVVGKIEACREGLGEQDQFVTDGYQQFYQAYTVKVWERIKGVSMEEKTITIYSEDGMTDCGFVFDVGKTYTIFLYKRQLCQSGVLREVDYTNVCTATARYRSADVDSMRQWKAEALPLKSYCDCLSKDGTAPLYPSCKQVTEKPHFEGGRQGWMDYLSTHLGSLETFNLSNTTLEFSYVINAEGQVTTVRLWRPSAQAHPELLKHLDRILAAAPRWTPGHCEGIPVPVWQKLWYCPCRKS